MTHTFRPAKREKVQLIIGAAGASGSGKTFSLLELAVGLAYPEASTDEELNAIIEREGRNRIAVVDTERGRALHYAPPPGEKARVFSEAAKREGAWFPFDHCAMEPPFSPDAYTEVIEAADDAGYAVIMADSFSHEWAGEGGVLEWHEAEQYKAAKRKANWGNQGTEREPGFKELEAVKMTAWIKPKMAHKKMIGRITTLRAHLLIGLRAEQKVKMIEEDAGNGRKKTKIVSAADLPPVERWTPVCEKAFPFELTLSFVLGPEAPGLPHKLKLQDQHAPFFPLDRQVSVETGRMLAAWARGAKAGEAAPAATGNGGQTKRSPRQLVDGYISGLAPPPEGKVASLTDLAEYQASASRFLGQLKAAHPDLHQECVEANGRRYSELTSEETEPFGEGELFGGGDGEGD